ncbi:MAG TPA: hypothetical protein DCX23_05125 [Lachnospiraceae bacterium]|nr:hypothetical protein [Lachnospiraceae bacterium]
MYDQLVAVYAIGWLCKDDYVTGYSQIVPARNADDLGVVISFDCEAPELEETLISPAGQKAHGINPLNWKTDDTVADKSENAGACFINYDGEITSEIPGLCGCYLDTERGVLKVTDVDSADYPPAIPVLPEGSYHVYDYQFFFRNLQQNVGRRIANYCEAYAKNAAA